MMGAGLDVLRRHLGPARITLVDVGARAGIDGRWRRAYPLLDVVGFEPDAEECRRLNDAAPRLPYAARFLPHALGAPGRMAARLHVTRSPGSSSLFEPNTEFVRDFPYADQMAVVGSAEVSLTTLDAVCAERGIVPACLKVDVQGAELDVLRGATSALRTTMLVELEVEFNPQYRDQPLFADVDAFLRSRDFRLLALRRTYWRRVAKRPPPPTAAGGQLIHGDALYYARDLVEGTTHVSAADVLTLCVALSAYRQADLLCHLLRTPHPSLAGIAEPERRAIERTLVTPPPIVARLLGGVLRLAAALLPVPMTHTDLRRALDTLREPCATDWHDPDFY